jgi:23S rRNA (uracil1939-C5)-methyltransferase
MDDHETNTAVGSEVRIEKWVYGGDGLSRVEGRVVLTPFVLPGELAAVETSPYKAGLLTGKVLELREPSPLRIEAPCAYFGRCGGCQYQHAPYEYQLAQKVEILREVCRRVGKFEAPADIAVVSGEPWAYRNRIQLHIERGEIGYRAASSHRLVPVESCPIASPRLNADIAALREMMRNPRFPVFLQSIELFTNESETQFNVLDTVRPLARDFFDWCEEKIPGASARTIDYRAAGEIFRVGHKSFFQVNRYLMEKLIETAVPSEGGGSALDLYAGVGLFSLPLAAKFSKVTAVESGSGAIRDLTFNASRGRRELKAEQSSVDLYLQEVKEAPDFILADPPRAGLGRTVVRELLRLRPQRLAIVACDPSTLARDLAPLLAGGFTLSSLTLVDLFPQTYHMETVVHLTAG